MNPLYHLLDSRERIIAHGSKEAVYAAASLLLGTRQLSGIYDPHLKTVHEYMLTARSDASFARSA
jgi:hypothetical protein